MNEKLLDELLKYLTAAEKALQAGGEVVASELKEVVTEIALWGFWSNLADVIFYLVMYCILFFVGKYLYANLWIKTDFNSRDSKEEPKCIMTIVTGIVYFILFFVSLPSLFDCKHSAMQCVKASVAPRIYVIEYVSKLAKDISKEKSKDNS